MVKAVAASNSNGTQISISRKIFQDDQQVGTLNAVLNLSGVPEHVDMNDERVCKIIPRLVKEGTVDIPDVGFINAMRIVALINTGDAFIFVANGTDVTALSNFGVDHVSALQITLKCGENFASMYAPGNDIYVTVEFDFSHLVEESPEIGTEEVDESNSADVSKDITSDRVEEVVKDESPSTGESTDTSQSA